VNQNAPIHDLATAETASQEEAEVVYGFDALTTEGDIVRIVEKIQTEAQDPSTLVLIDDQGRTYQRSESQPSQIEEIDVVGELPETEPVAEDDAEEPEAEEEDDAEEPEAEEEADAEEAPEDAEPEAEAEDGGSPEEPQEA
jgi:hypothetical protein